MIKASLVYCALAGVFSIVGIFLPDKTPQQTPVLHLNVNEILGHIAWGLGVGAASLSLRYFLLGGSFAILLDSDHLIGFAPVETVARMGHSIFFGAISVVIMMVLLGKRDYLLGAVVAGALLAHLSYDTFAAADGQFPIFVPFYDIQITFPHQDWVIFEMIGVAIVALTMILTKKAMYQKAKY